MSTSGSEHQTANPPIERTCPGKPGRTGTSNRSLEALVRSRLGCCLALLLLFGCPADPPSLSRDSGAPDAGDRDAGSTDDCSADAGCLLRRLSHLSWSSNVNNNSLYQVIAADVNGDGRVDLVLFNSSRQLITLEGNGDGTFHAPYVAGPFALGTLGVGSFDVNGDGRADLFGAPYGSLGESVVMTYTGAGAWTELRRWPGTTTTGLIDDDDRLDYAVTDGAHLAVHLADGLVVDDLWSSVDAGGASFAVGRTHRNDSRVGLVDAFNYSSQTGAILELVSVTDGGLTHQIERAPLSVTYFAPRASADLNRDGLLDFAGPIFNGPPYLLVGSDAGVTTRFLNHFTQCIAAGNDILTLDLDGDGAPELLTPCNEGSRVANAIYVVHGRDLVELLAGQHLSDSPGRIATADFNGDGKEDVVVVHERELFVFTPTR